MSGQHGENDCDPAQGRAKFIFHAVSVVCEYDPSVGRNALCCCLAPILYHLLAGKESDTVLLNRPAQEGCHMPRVSAKRQITLPIDQCREVGIGPGDEFHSFVADGSITIVRKSAGAARGFLRHVGRDSTVTDE